MNNKLVFLFCVFLVSSGCDSVGNSVVVADNADQNNADTDTNEISENNENEQNSTVEDTDSRTSPNILFIISDDQGIDASAQYSVSRDLPTTPVIDALASRGLVFDNAWATPSCTTTRGCLISGQHGVNSGVDTTPSLMDPNTLTLQRFLSTANTSENYATAVIGKWHLAGGSANSELMHPNDSGVDYYAGNITGTLDSYTDWPLTINGVTTQSSEYHTSAVTTMAIDWIGQQDNPWFMWLAYVSPHSPFHLPPDNLHTQNLPGSAQDIENNPRAYFLAAIEAMDTEIGRLFDSIPPDEMDNTLIIFLGDNGTPRAVIDSAAFETSHGKSSLYEGGIRVPMIAAGKGVSRSNEREDALINAVDFFPTISEAVGLASPAQTDGTSFYKLLSDPTASSRTFNYSEFIGNQANGWTVRSDNLKLISFADGSKELYDLINDPKELNNLIEQTDEYGNEINALEAFGLNVRSETLSGTPSGPIDLTGSILVNQSTSCVDYANDYVSIATDVNNNDFYNGDLNITVDGNQCVLTTNAIPNHDFNDAQISFPNNVSEQNNEYRLPINPVLAANRTQLNLTVDNAILLNGVKVDILAAGCFGVGDGRVGCNDPDQPWRFDPINPAGGFLVDSHNAHTQPDGTYHYHARPNALFSTDEPIESPVVGFAADGFPIFGSFINDNGLIREVRSSYRLKSGTRPTGPGQPGGTFDGTYRDDYEFVNGLGDLDECNGMTMNGRYRYFITTEFPYVLGCYSGTPDPSFTKR